MPTSKAHAERVAIRNARGELERLLGIASLLIEASAAALVLVRNGVSRVIGCTQPVSAHATFRWPNDYKPYDPERTHVLTNITDFQLSKSIKTILGVYRKGSLVRLPVVIEQDFVVALVLYTASEDRRPSKHEMLVLESLAKAMAADARAVAAKLLLVSSHDFVVTETIEELSDAVLRDEGLRMLATERVVPLAISRGLKSQLRQHIEQGFDEAVKPFDLAAWPLIAPLAKRALKAGATSPEVEIPFRSGEHLRLAAVRINPIRPIDSDNTLLEVKLTLVEPFGSSTLIGISSSPAEGEDEGTAESYLLETLRKQRSIRKRGQSSYVTLRTWRKPQKKYQIAALRIAKRTNSPLMAHQAAAECADEVRNIVGASGFRSIVPVPCGHSPPSRCLATAIARYLGLELNIPVIRAFANMEGAPPSHPRNNALRPPMQLIQDVPGPAILVDDVATSGSHISEASTLLRKAGTECFAIAWIGTDG